MLVKRDRMNRLHATSAAALLNRLQATAEPARPGRAEQELDTQHRPSRPLAFRRRSYRLDAVVPLATWDLWVEVLQAIDQARLATHHSLVVRPLGPLPKREHLFRVPPIAGETDGVVMVGVSPSADVLEWLSLLDVPAVLVDREHPTLSSVVVDHQAAAATAVRHLLSIGHQRIAFIDRSDVPFAPQSSASARRRGYRAALAMAGLLPRLGFEREGDESMQAGWAAAKEWLASPEPPTAVFAGSDRLALGVLQWAQEHGMRVPDDLAVVGYGDTGIAAYLGLSTVHVPTCTMGQRAVEVLVDALRDPEHNPKQVSLPTELVIRRTCGGA